MNILRIINDFADPLVQATGLSTGPYELTLAQAQNKENNIYVLTGNLNFQNLKRLKFSYKLADNVTVYNLPRAVWQFGPFLTASVAVLPYYFYLKLTKKIELVHNHQQMGVWFLLYKYIFGNIDKTPVVHTNHGPIVTRMQKAKQSGEKYKFMTRNFVNPIHMFSDWLSIKVADVQTPCSFSVQHELEENYECLNEVHTVENGVNTLKFRREGECADLGFSDDKIILGNIGRLSQRKNIDLIVETLQLLPDKYVLVLIGEWDQQLRQKVEDFIKENKLEERVKYLGSIDYWEIDKYFRALDIFLLPSKHEGLPKVVLEALACGNRVVASGFSLSKTIPNLTFLQDLTKTELKSNVEQIAVEKDQFDETFKMIEENYSWNSKARELEDIYKRCIKKKAAYSV